MGLIAEFRDYLLVRRRYSSRTASIYCDVVEDYLRFAYPETPCGQGGPDSSLEDGDILEALRFQLIRGYVSRMMDRSLDARTVNLHLSALSTFCNYLVRQKKLTSNPVKEITRPKEKKRLPSFFTPEALAEYFDSPCADGYLSVRNRMVVTLLFDTGLRRAEAASLRISDIDLSRLTISVIGKGNKQRIIPIVGSLAEKIGDYLDLREEFAAKSGKASSDAFFLTDKGAPAYVEFINRVVKAELSAIKGISGKKTPHTLRHSFATALLNDGADLNSIKEVLGHSSLAATEVYTHNSFEKLKEIYKTAHPRAKK
ncbi:MAG: tyrosine-type recombinase/integrase [Bacteroidales bacterium]|nr:tyrosine-type recombinase/integrase [Bacteroidales bacterium]